MTPSLQNLIMDVQELARAKGVQRFRVVHKVNAGGELIVALIISDTEGPLAVHRFEPRPRGRVER